MLNIGSDYFVYRTYTDENGDGVTGLTVSGQLRGPVDYGTDPTLATQVTTFSITEVGGGDYRGTILKAITVNLLAGRVYAIKSDPVGDPEWEFIVAGHGRIERA